MKRILSVITGLGLGGAEIQLVHLASQLKARGWEVQVVSLTPAKACVDDLQRRRIPVASLDITRKVLDPRPFLRLVRLIRTSRPQIVHSHMVHANLLARLVRPLAPVQVLISTACSLYEGGRLRELLYRLTDPLCDLTTHVSQAGLERYVRVKAVPRQKIRFIPNGVDTLQFYPNHEARARLRAELGLGGRFAWLAVGRFDKPKDYPTMLRAFAQVVREHPEAILLIAGDGPLRPAMEKLRRVSYLDEKLQFLGVRRDVPELMNATDAYVMSSAWEGMPNVLLEAGATGLPIVATDVGGNREVVIDGQTGYLVPPRDPEALAGAMLHLMALPAEERRRMGEAGRHYVAANYSLEWVVNQWEALYRELLAQKGIQC